MKFWSYIADFLLFRWLTGLFRQKDSRSGSSDLRNRHDSGRDRTEDIDAHLDGADGCYGHDYLGSYYDEDESQWNDEMLDEFDDYDIRDDYDLTDHYDVWDD